MSAVPSSVMHLPASPLTCCPTHLLPPTVPTPPHPTGPSRSGVLVFNGAVTVNDGNGWQGAIVGALQTQMQVGGWPVLPL